MKTIFISKKAGAAAFTAFCFCFAACGNGTTHKHEWGEWQTTAAPTCTTKGVETRVCALDETHTETRPVPVDGSAHAWGAWTRTRAPTSTQAGEDTRTCALDPLHKETRSVPVTVTFAGNSQLTTIAANAFANCTSLTEITIPASVTSIGSEAFADCTSLALVTCLRATPPTLDTFVFYNTTTLANLASLQAIKVPTASVGAYQAAANWITYASIISAI